jgi:hypothetical protein
MYNLSINSVFLHHVVSHLMMYIFVVSEEEKAKIAKAKKRAAAKAAEAKARADEDKKIKAAEEKKKEKNRVKDTGKIDTDPDGDELLKASPLVEATKYLQNLLLFSPGNILFHIACMYHIIYNMFILRPILLGLVSACY